MFKRVDYVSMSSLSLFLPRATVFREDNNTCEYDTVQIELFIFLCLVHKAAESSQLFLLEF
jgi:hypothetical protein